MTAPIKQSRARKTLIDEPPKTSVIPPKTPGTVEELANELGEDIVLVTIPKPFILTDDQFRMFPYAAGHAKMPRSHAEHWYSKRLGVTIHKG